MVCTASSVEPDTATCSECLPAESLESHLNHEGKHGTKTVAGDGSYPFMCDGWAAAGGGSVEATAADTEEGVGGDGESAKVNDFSFDDGDDTVRMVPTASMSFPQQPVGGAFHRNKSSASIVSAYRMLRNGSVGSSGCRRQGDKMPLGSVDLDEVDVVYERGPPDGGWGWMVLLGTVIVNTLIPGLSKSFGVFFTEFIDVFQASPSSVAWIPALTFALYNLLGPVASMISMRYSCRLATILGGLSATVGLALSYFATSIEYLYFSYGVLGGIGAGMSYTPGILIVGQYFNRRRGLANGICASGSALGSIILPPFLNFLLLEYGYRGAILIMCGLIMNVWVGAALYQPVEWHLKRTAKVAVGGATDEINGNRLERNPSRPDNLKALAAQEEHRKPKPGDSQSPASSRRLVLRRPQSNPRFMPGLSAAAEEEGDGDNNKVGGTSAPTVSFIVGGAGISPQNVGSGTVVGLGMGSTSSGLAPVLGLHRSPSIVSTISSSSFAYLSTIYHGSTPAAYQLNQIAGGHRDSLSESRGALSVAAAPFSSQTLGGRCRCVGKCACTRSGAALPAAKAPSIWKLMFDVALLKNSVFLLITYTVVASGIGYTNLLIMLPSYAATLGIEKAKCALLLSVIAGADLVGRIGGAWISDFASFPCKYLYMGGFIVSGLALMFLPHYTTFEGLASCCAVFGLFSGVYIGLMAVLLVNHLGAEKLGSSFGLSLAVNGVVMMSGPPLCNTISESIGSRPVLFILGVIILTGGLILVLEPLASGHEKKKLDSLVDIKKAAFV